MNKLKEIMEAIFISIFAGIIVWIIQEHYSFSVLIVVKIIVLIILFILLAYLIKLYLKLKSLGIINVLDSQVKGEGSTKVFMNKTNHELCFVGIAATKWLDETDTFEKTIRRICGHQSGKIRFLLLNPNSEVAHKMNVSLKQDNINEKKITKKIEMSLHNIKEIVKKINEEEGG